MNSRFFNQIGIPSECKGIAIQASQSMAKYNRTVEKPLRYDINALITHCASEPEAYTGHTHLAELARELIVTKNFKLPDPIGYETWGADGIDTGTHHQMQAACALPVASGAALMPDAHVGYGLPIGGVLALDNAVCPYAVGVDIACRMKLSIFDVRPEALRKHRELFENALWNGTVFGMGQEQDTPVDHPVLAQDWSITEITKQKRETIAQPQLGTSGTGNHFVEWGVVYLDKSDLGLDAGEYVALMSHSGSRGSGAAVCNIYHARARRNLPQRYEQFSQLAWLGLDTADGQEYWEAMNLMGDYAAANHDVIHRKVSRLVGERAVTVIENHHNFAWRETHNGKEAIVHRKGATPAGVGVLGVIPGSMGDAAYVVRGKGHPKSLASASHGAGRQMSRTKAREKYSFGAVQGDLAMKDITVLRAGADEVPGAYKNIEEVMAAQTDLVEKVARWLPRIVLMAGDGEKPED